VKVLLNKRASARFFAGPSDQQGPSAPGARLGKFPTELSLRIFFRTIDTLCLLKAELANKGFFYLMGLWKILWTWGDYGSGFTTSPTGSGVWVCGKLSGPGEIMIASLPQAPHH